MFASLQNKFSNYRTSSLRFDIEKNIIIEAFDRFASISTESFLLKVQQLTPLINDAGESAIPRIIDTVSRRPPVSLIREVGDSPYR